MPTQFQGQRSPHRRRGVITAMQDGSREDPLKTMNIIHQKTGPWRQHVETNYPRVGLGPSQGTLGTESEMCVCVCVCVRARVCFASQLLCNILQYCRQTPRILTLASVLHTCFQQMCMLTGLPTCQSNVTASVILLSASLMSPYRRVS